MDDLSITVMVMTSFINAKVWRDDRRKDHGISGLMRKAYDTAHPHAHRNLFSNWF